MFESAKNLFLAEGRVRSDLAISMSGMQAPVLRSVRVWRLNYPPSSKSPVSPICLNLYNIAHIMIRWFGKIVFRCTQFANNQKRRKKIIRLTKKITHLTCASTNDTFRVSIAVCVTFIKRNKEKTQERQNDNDTSNNCA